jgi:DNA polymerase III delta prime subunit
VSTTAPAPGFLAIGQPVAERLARRMLADTGAPPTILVHGPAGSGKGAFVDDLLATVLCEAPDPDARPCNQCAGCRQARSRTHPDLVVASPATWREARGTGESIVGVARRWLSEVAGAPIASRWRVIVIDQADGANEQVQNALLKALEEPGDRQLFILVADDPLLLLPTIRSRVQPVRVGRVPQAELAEWLVRSAHVTDEQAAALARLADGRVGRALAFANAPEQVEWRRRTQHEILGLLERGRADRMASVREMLDEASRVALPTTVAVGEEDTALRTPTGVQRAAAIAITDAWVDLTRDLAVAAAGAPQLAASSELVPDLAAAAQARGAGEWADTALTIERIRDALQENVSPRLALETAMLAWPEIARR